jgi:hypothetical protein
MKSVLRRPEPSPFHVIWGRGNVSNTIIRTATNRSSQRVCHVGAGTPASNQNEGVSFSHTLSSRPTTIDDPKIMTNSTPWSNRVTNGCGIWPVNIGTGMSMRLSLRRAVVDGGALLL